MLQIINWINEKGAGKLSGQVGEPESYLDVNNDGSVSPVDVLQRTLPAGNRYIADPLDHKTPGYPDPDPDCMEFLASRGVMTLGTDSASD